MAKLARWQPITEVERWFDRMDRWFDHLFKRTMDRFFHDWDGEFWKLESSQRVWMPALDISETPDAYIVRVEVPGVKAEDLEVSLQDNTLTIRGKRERSEERKEETYHWVERSYGEFTRSLALPSDVKVDAIDATYRNGVLEIRLPKSEESKPHRIEVKSA